MEGYYWRLERPGVGALRDRAVRRLPRAATGRGRSSRSRRIPGGFVRWANAAGGGGRAGRARRRRVGGRRRAGAARRPSGGSRSTSARTRAWRPCSRAARRGRGGRSARSALAQAVPGLPQYWQPGGARRARARRGGARRRDRRRSTAGTPTSRRTGAARSRASGGGARPRSATARWRRSPAAGSAARSPRARSSCAPAAPLVRFAPPGAVVTAAAGGGEWRLRARSPRWSVLLEGEAAAPPHILPVPVPAERRAVMRSEHHLAGRMRVVLRRGRRVVLRAESARRRARARHAGDVGGLNGPRPAARPRPSGSAPTSRSKRPITVHSARSRSAARASTGSTRASETSSARPSPPVARPSARTPPARCPARPSRGTRPAPRAAGSRGRASRSGRRAR